MSTSAAIDLQVLSDAAHVDAVLRCWVRERNVTVTEDGIFTAVPGTALNVSARCTHVSRTGLHSFTDVAVVKPDGSRQAVGAEELLALLTTGAEPQERSLLLQRTRESIGNISLFAGRDRGAVPVLDGPLFLTGERSLLLGHLQHPAPKSRDNLSAAELEAYSPELGGQFQMHWFEAHRSVVTQDQAAGAPSLGGKDVHKLLADIAGHRPAPDHVLIPAHPWQAQAVQQRPAVRELMAAGLLRPLGPLGDEWWATSSLRTLFHPDHSVMLKLSLGLKITNSVREATATELKRGVEVNRLIDAGYITHSDPGFTIVRDPASAAVIDPSDPSGGTLTGLDVSLREVPDGVDRFVCLAGLIAPSAPAGPDTWGPSLLARWCGDPLGWLGSYVDRVLVPMLRLYTGTGIGLEGHQQNTLVRLDAEGCITGGAYRDNQGYYLAASRLGDVLASTGGESSTLAVVDDAIVDDRLTYYLLHNQTLSLVGAMAAEGMADEELLLAVVRERLQAALPSLAEAGPAGPRLVNRWLTAPSLPCKAHLATRLAGIDEVVAPLDAQSVYLEVPNPLVVGA
ncbi:IucA/IucC family protein [Arthrobacter sp. NPDC093125]|uniref:IucA/IucC family protein n=1 Tax=Arthrobacter sp. NPDC093125 TaxID=3363944 RepID=UPI00380DA983